MKHTVRLLCVVVFYFSFFITHANTTGPLSGKTFLQPRSVGTNAARELVGWRHYINKKTDKWLYGAFNVTPAYSHTFRPARIAEYFFGCDTITISGSQVTNRDTNHMLADYFGLSPTFFSTVKIKPKLKNTSIDLDLYLGCTSFYVRILAPINWARSNIELHEIVSNNGNSTAFSALYMDTTSITPPVTSFTEAIRGNITFGDLTEGLDVCKISECARNEFHVADVHVAAGWNFISRETGHAGLNLRFVAPTGNRPTGEYMFEPIVGNGHHWEFGFGFTGHVMVWEYGADRSISLYTDLNITHLFDACQRRCFDISIDCCTDMCKQNVSNVASRYILVKEFDANNYIGKLVPLANKTTLNCNVKTGLQFDFVFMVGYTGPMFNWDFGYNGWIRTKESICITDKLEESTIGLKGLQNVDTGAGNSNATQSNATINGNNTGDATPGLFVNQATLVDATSPIFLKNTDLDRKSAANPRAFTHKLFAYIDYHHVTHTCPWINTFFIGAGGEIEFESAHRRRFTKPNKNSLSQWSLWLKTGVAF
ncbi:hypothetical protein KC460_00070 [Candidatus Dependentiae bacterium]|nr:hypothetical protein [Candidatus Dependentiae bacterium]